MCSSVGFVDAIQNEHDKKITNHVLVRKHKCMILKKKWVLVGDVSLIGGGRVKSEEELTGVAFL